MSSPRATQGVGKILSRALLNPLVLLLAALPTISFMTGGLRSGVAMPSTIVLSAGLKALQEARADNIATKLKAMILAGEAQSAYLCCYAIPWRISRRPGTRK
jgi:magnesium-transporting ATPase (P-type)